MQVKCTLAYKLKPSVIVRYPQLKIYFNTHNPTPRFLYGKTLYELVKLTKPNYRDCVDINIYWDRVRTLRNELVHHLGGLTKDELFQVWNTDSLIEWESRVLGCLNFLSDRNFVSLSEASLMPQVHQELTEAMSGWTF